MAKLITSDNFDKYAPSSWSLSFTDMEQSVLYAEREYLLPILGQATLTELKTALDGTPGTEQAALIEYCREAVGRFAFYEYAPEGQVIIDGRGINITDDDTRKVASDSKVQQLTQSLRKKGYRALEAALNYLESQKATFTTWASSAERTAERSLFVSSADIMGLYTDIGQPASRLMYIKTLPALRRQQDMIEEALTTTQYSEYSTNWTANTISGLSSAKQTEFTNIQKAISILAWCDQHRTLADYAEEIGLGVTGMDDRLLETMRTSGQYYLARVTEGANTKSKADYDADGDYDFDDIADHRVQDLDKGDLIA